MLPFLLLLIGIFLNGAEASGGLNIFVLHTDMFSLAMSLTILVFITIVFELTFHHLKHAYHHDEIVSEIIQKVTAELTVLGFISITTILVVQNAGSNPAIVESLGEFEIAHVWLFFIGLMFVIEALLFILYAKIQTKNLFMFERANNMVMSTHLVNQQETCGQRCIRFCPIRFPCDKCCSSRKYSTASHKLHRVLFKHFYKNEIMRHLKLYYKDFDFGAYLYAFIRHEIVGLQEIAVSSWVFFLFIFWVVTLIRQSSLWGDTSTTMTSIYLNWSCFCLIGVLLLEAFYSHSKIHQLLAKVITGENNKHLSDAVMHLTEISYNPETWDHDAQAWDNPLKYRKEGECCQIVWDKALWMAAAATAASSNKESRTTGTAASKEVELSATELETGVASSTGSSALRVWKEHKVKFFRLLKHNLELREKNEWQKKIGKKIEEMSTADQLYIQKIEKVRDMLRKNVYLRLKGIQRKHLKVQSCFSNRLRQVLFSELFRLSLLSVHCSLFIVHCSLFIVHCSLFIVHCSVHCLLFIVHCD